MYAEQLSNYCARAAADVSARVRAEAASSRRSIVSWGFTPRQSLRRLPRETPPRGSAALLPDRQAARAVYELGVRLETLQGDLEQARAERVAQQATATHALQTRLQALEVRLAESRQVEEQLRARERELVSAGERIRPLERELTTARQELHAVDTELASARQELRALDGELAAFRGLTSLRLVMPC